MPGYQRRVYCMVSYGDGDQKQEYTQISLTVEDSELEGDKPRAVLVKFRLVLKLLVFFAVLVALSSPAFHRILKDHTWILQKLVFSTLFTWPPWVNLAYPTNFGLFTTRNFYMDVEKDVTIGAWHTLPANLTDEREVQLDEYEETLASAKLVFLYLHGNSGSRGAYHRIQMYKFLAKMGAHVLTVDYRGFGESTGEPTEEGVVKDAHFAYKWLKEKTNGAPIFIWGHSLGTGISTHLARKLCIEGDPPLGVVLESPFNNIADAAYFHPFSILFSYIPGFKALLDAGLKAHNLHFSSDKSITKVTSHILILHARDDLVVPISLGQKLYEEAQRSRSHLTKNVEFVEFESHRRFGHKHIYQAPELKDKIREFVQNAFQDPVK